MVRRTMGVSLLAFGEWEEKGLARPPRTTASQHAAEALADEWLDSHRQPGVWATRTWGARENVADRLAGGGVKWR